MAPESAFAASATVVGMAAAAGAPEPADTGAGAGGPVTGAASPEATASGAGPVPLPPAAPVSVPVTVAAACPPAELLPNSSARQDANWPRILSPTSAMTPRPNWAGLPVICISVRTLTFVLPPSSVIVSVALADAVPLPRESRPWASTTTLWLVRSRSTNVPLPL